jgi:hypothetical protein
VRKNFQGWGDGEGLGMAGGGGERAAARLAQPASAFNAF